jgi:hypothetical protein
VTNPYLNTGRVPYAKTMEATRSGDAMVVDPKTQALMAQQVYAAPMVAQSAEALRSGDYFVPPTAPRPATTIVRPVATPVDPRMAQYMKANAPKIRFTNGGTMRRVYH